MVLGVEAHHVDESEGWSLVAGVTVGQDISDRRLQLSGSPPQFSLGKSFPGFSPLGPVVVTPDGLDDKDDLALGCEVNGELMQQGRTSELIFSVPKLIAYLSAITPLLPGDLIFTGTPAGVGHRRNPPRYLQPGDVLRSFVSGIGEIQQSFVGSH